MMAKPTHESFNDILLKGKLSYYGMANFSDVLKPEDVEAIHQYLISVQKERFERIERNKKSKKGLLLNIIYSKINLCP